MCAFDISITLEMSMFVCLFVCLFDCLFQAVNVLNVGLDDLGLLLSFLLRILVRNQRICFQLMVDCWFGARWFGFLGSPYERDSYLGVSIESQTTGPQTNNLPLVERMESKKTHLKQNNRGPMRQNRCLLGDP